MSTNAAGSSMPTLETLCRQFGEILDYATRLKSRSSDIDRYLESGNEPPTTDSKDAVGLTEVPPLLQIQELGQLINSQLTAMEGSIERSAGMLGVTDPHSPQVRGTVSASPIEGKTPGGGRVAF